MSYYSDKLSILNHIDELQKAILDGDIPTWYGCQEIDRLQHLLKRTETDLAIDRELRHSEIVKSLQLLDDIERN